jgi:hypothetical protein
MVREAINLVEERFVANLLILEPNADVAKVMEIVDYNVRTTCATWE